MDNSEINRPRTRSQAKSEVSSKSKGKEIVDGAPISKEISTSVIRLALEVAPKRIVQISHSTKILSNAYNDAECEEELASLTRKKNAPEKVAQVSSDLKLTSDIAHVKIQGEKA